MTNKIVVLAAGRGTRMQAPSNASLSPAQAAAADVGAKAMIPIDRPFLDYALSAYADAGCRDACLVVGPAHREIRDYYNQLATHRLSIHFAIQDQPIGGANAVLSARAFVGDDAFIVVNSDNYYPAAVITELRQMRAPALVAFSRDALLADGQIEPGRINAFALLDIASDGTLLRIVEKPSAQEAARLPDARVSMTCWHFTPDIFEACAGVARSTRGEFELPAAVQLAIDSGRMRFQTLAVDAPVLDLSSRADIPAVAERLRSVRVDL